MYAHNIGKIQLSPIVSTISLCSLRGPHGALDSDVYWPAQDLNRLPTAVRSPELSLASFKRQLKTHSSVPALDSAGCSCGCRVRSSGAVVTVHRVRHWLQMSRLDMNHLENTHCLVFVTYCAAPANLIWATPIWRRRCFWAPRYSL